MTKLFALCSLPHVFPLFNGLSFLISGLNPPLAPGGFGMQQAIGAAAQMGLAVPAAGSSVVHVSNLDEEVYPLSLVVSP